MVKNILKKYHSILEQTYKEFEFLILDDASTDNTANILTEFTERDSQSKYFIIVKILDLLNHLTT